MDGWSLGVVDVMVSFKKASLTGAKDTLAVILITKGADVIASGDYLVGGLLVVAGWILLVVDHYFAGSG